LTAKFTAKIEALESTIHAAKLTKSNPEIPQREFKDDVAAVVDDRTISEIIAAEQREMYLQKQKEKEA